MDTPMKRLPFIFALAAGTASSAVALAQNEPTVTVTACDGKPCAEAKYCKRVSCESPGVCAPRPKACNDIYMPVCGCDGVTYGNACSAARAGGNVARARACPSPKPERPPPPSPSCGAKGCAEGMYCALGADCGASDPTGVCRPLEKDCNDIYLPVCGCDQKTYGNACDAASRGVSVAHDGTCEKPEPVGAPPPVEAKGPRCGARGAPACAEGMYCALGADCGASDPTGVCRPLEKECDAIYRPVCGCDQKTYGNACEAASKGVSVAQQGACK